MSADKKNDDSETPAEWAARQARYPRVLRPTSQADEQLLRRRSDRDDDTKRYYQSARNWRPETPLVDRVDNSWRNEKKPLPYHDEYDPVAKFCDPDDESSCPSVTSRMAQSRKWRRLFLVLVVVLGGFCYTWATYIWPIMQYDYALKAGFLRQTRGTFGMAISGEYGAKERIVQLDDVLIPGGATDPDGKRRLVFVGDIHGCKDELLKLLHHVDFKEGQDHLIATGDIISKGPDSAGVVDELIRLGATSVRGNHEDRLLTLANYDVEKYGEPELLTKTAQEDGKLLKHLKSHHLTYLRSLPLILRIPPLPLASSKGRKKDKIRSEILVVHAGLVPAVPLTKQDPYYVMNMRSLQRSTHVPSVELASKHDHTLPWSESWNWFNGRLDHGRIFSGWHKAEPGLEAEYIRPGFVDIFLNFFTNFKGGRKARPQVIVYGHDSRTGFVNKKWSKGLDSRCVRGGELTALVLDAYGHEKFYSVKCKDHKE